MSSPYVGCLPTVCQGLLAVYVPTPVPNYKHRTSKMKTMSGGFFQLRGLWRGNNPAECTGAFHLTGGVVCPIGLGNIAPKPIQLS